MENKEMTPERQKAEELVRDFNFSHPNHELYVAIQCAIVCVKNILKARPGFPYPHEVGADIVGILNTLNYPEKYWQKVLEELENM